MRIGFSTLGVAAVLAGLPLVAGVRAQQAAAPAPAPAAPPAAYLLGPGDRMRVTVFGEPAMTGEYAVTDGGLVSFPLIGDVPAAGRTPAAVRDAIRAALADGYIKDPRVAVEIVEYRTFYILGEVNKPGEYPYRAGLTVEQAVATAGGYTYRANRKRFDLVHSGEAAATRQLFRDAGRLRVRPGDTIRIAERFF